MTCTPGRRLAVAAAAVAVHLGLGWRAIRASAPTYDEPVHLAAGFQDLAAGTYRLNALDHPPFAEMWGALPLLALRPSPMYQDPDLAARRVYHFADSFLYRNRVPAGRMLDAGRLWCLLTWGLLSGVALLSWAWRLSGGAGLCAAALFYALCPALIANAGLVATDAASTALFLAAFWLLAPAAPAVAAPGAAATLPVGPGGRRPWRWAAAGAAMGLAMAAKFNMFILPGLAAVMLLVEARAGATVRPAAGGSRREARPFPWAGFLILCAAALAALALVYRGRWLGLYWEGLSATLTRLGAGRPSFLHGSHGTQGWFLYFPVALLVKTPLPLLAAAGLGLGLWLRAPDIGRFWACAPAAAYFLAALLSKTQIGVRHVLPVYPFMILAAADAAAWAWRSRGGKGACALLAAWLAVSVGRAGPHMLAYFNEAAGGPEGGWRWLVDSNLDWGQGLKDLAAILARRGNPPVYLCYFGVADPSYYGIRYKPVAFITHVSGRDGTAEPGPSDPVLFAVSATNLQAVYYAQKDVFSWLKARAPAASAGHSIFLYDLTGDPEGRRLLAEVLAASGDPEAARRLLSRH